MTVTGTNLSGASVAFGSSAATGVVVNAGGTSLTANSPAGTGTVDVIATTPGGPSATSSADHFTYVPAPTVTGVSPGAGPSAGGTTVTVTGTNLTAATVAFGPSAATGVVINAGGTSLTATSPAGSGTVDVTATTAGGTSATSSADHFTYVPAPTVTGVSPSSGPVAGGTLVTVTGTNLSGASVAFGPSPGTAVKVNAGGTSLTTKSPAGSGTVDVIVTTAGGSSATSIADQFTYLGHPSVSGVSPTSGPTAGGTVVTITGSNLAGTTAVNFGSQPASGVSVNMAGTSLTATSPPGTGTVDVKVVNPVGTSPASSADKFTYLNPTITIANTAQLEGNSGQTPMNFPVSLSWSSPATVSVSYATADGATTSPPTPPATAGSDYIAVSSASLTFSPGQTQAVIPIQIVGDTVPEPDESFTVKLSGPSGATIATTKAAGTIDNDDAPIVPTNVSLTVAKPSACCKKMGFSVTLDTLCPNAKYPNGPCVEEAAEQAKTYPGYTWKLMYQSFATSQLAFVWSPSSAPGTFTFKLDSNTPDGPLTIQYTVADPLSPATRRLSSRSPSR